MSLATRLKALPQTLFWMCLAFALIPVWASFSVEWPWITYASKGWVQASVHAAVYWIVPWLLTLAILLRSIAVLPLLFLQSSAMVFATVTATSRLGDAATALRLGSLFVAVAIGLVFASRDILTPLLGRRSRAFRKAPRLAGNLRATLSETQDGAGPRVIVEDLSLTGIALAGNIDELKDLAGKGNGTPVHLKVTAGSRSTTVTSTVRWAKEQDGLLRFGLAVDDEDLMNELVGLLDNESRTGVDRAAYTFQRFWVKSSVKRAVIVVWCASLAGSFGSPACGRIKGKHVSYRSGGAVTSKARRNQFGAPAHLASSDRGFSDGGIFGHAGGGGFGLADGSNLRLAYTGPDLFGECSGADRTSLADEWSQSKLLSLFQGEKDYYASMLRSFEETDWTGTRRPGMEPVYFGLRSKLGAGAVGVGWIMNLVRFRPDHIKINFELNLGQAGVHPDVKFAALIHAFAVKGADIVEYQRDVARLSDTSGPVGCELLDLLNRWLPRTSYFFAHSNIFFKSPFMMTAKWRFAEAKVVRNGDTDSLNEFWSTPHIFGRDDNPAYAPHTDDRTLTIVPMAFDIYQKVNGKLVPVGPSAQVAMWFSEGEDLDAANGLGHMGRNIIADPGVDLIRPDPVTGMPVPLDDPVREVDAVHTCAQCHAGPSNKDFSNHFRHVGWGIHPPFGVPRQDNAATFSEGFERMLKRNAESVAASLTQSGVYTCEGDWGYANVQAALTETGADCASCHRAGTGRSPLTNEGEWRTMLDASAMFVEMGTMPPGADQERMRPLARALFCWGRKVQQESCDRLTDYDAEIAPHEGTCATAGCHDGHTPGRISLRGELAWRAYHGAAHQLMRAGTMPPPSENADPAVVSSLKEAARCLK